MFLRYDNSATFITAMMILVGCTPAVIATVVPAVISACGVGCKPWSRDMNITLPIVV
jgi:hypothetical protein